MFTLFQLIVIFPYVFYGLMVKSAQAWSIGIWRDTRHSRRDSGPENAVPGP